MRAVADRMRDHPGFAENLSRDRDQPRFAVLFDPAHPAYHYLKMLQDDTYVYSGLWQTFSDAGASANSDASDDDEGALRPAGRDRFAALLRGLTTSRSSIARAMAFAVDHAASAEEVSTRLSRPIFPNPTQIVDIIIGSLILAETPVPRKMARLYLVGAFVRNLMRPV